MGEESIYLPNGDRKPYKKGEQVTIDYHAGGYKVKNAKDCNTATIISKKVKTGSSNTESGFHTQKARCNNCGMTFDYQYNTEWWGC